MASTGKALTDPLLLLLLLTTGSLLVAWKNAGQRVARRAIALALGAVLLLAVLSTGFMAATLEHSLLVEPRPGGRPDVIVVAGGGSKRYSLSPSTMNRVVAGASWWKEHREARLIMAGADTLAPGITSTRTLDLMRDTAVRLGVPADAITLEARSTTTREHPLRLRELAGIQPGMTIGVVTSGWHMRRTRREFERWFPNVVTRDADRPGDRYWIINDIIPSSNDLADSTVMVHEWIGVAWYALRG